MALYVCTRFPDLSSSISCDEGSPSEPQSRQILDLHVGANVVVLAWGLLLKAYTGEPEPVFYLDDVAVKADLERKTWREVEVDGVLGNANDTAVDLYEHKRLPGSKYLSLSFDEKSCIGTIWAARTFPKCHMDEIVLQFKEIIAREMQTTLEKDSCPSLSILNRNPQFLNGPTLLNHLFEKHANSDRYAIDFLEHDGSRTTLSYQQVEERASCLAVKIRQSCSSATTSTPRIVPVLVPQSPELYVTLLAILKSGAAFCPLNLDAPCERMKFVVHDVSAQILITTSRCKHLLPADLECGIVLADDPANFVDAAELSVVDVNEEDLAYVMYTSGSTGLPKGVGISHRAATQSLLAHNRFVPEFRRFLQFASPTFDVFVFEIFFTLYRGCTLVSAVRAELLADLPGIINRLDIDGAELTPTVVSGLIRTRKAVPNLKLLLTIGEMLTRSVVDEFGDSSEQKGCLYAMYGPTEAVIHCTLAPNLSKVSKVGVIGIPLDTVSCYIVEPASPETGQFDQVSVLPVGHIGELALGGNQLAFGYLNRPQQTAEAFLETKAYGRLYRTGDKARLLPDGSLECLGRMSSGQVKLRGQRIELGEVEQVVCKTPGVQLAVANIIDGILVAFCQSSDATLECILNTCRTWLPRFMVPGDLVIHEELPRLPSGKIDRKGLDAQYRSKRRDDIPVNDAFDDEVDRAISQCVDALLERHVDLRSSLAFSGLDSLKAISLASRLRSMDMNMTVMDVLNSDSIKSLATIVRKRPKPSKITTPDDHKSPVTVSPEIRHDTESVLKELCDDDDIDDVLYCAPIQVAMLAETAVNPKAYWNWIELEFPSTNDASLIENALHTLARNNEILRSGFVFIENHNCYVQFVRKSLARPQIATVSEFDFNTAITLEYPLKVQIRRAKAGLRCLFYIHHGIYDGWSWDLILNDLCDILLSRQLKIRPNYRTIVQYFRRYTTLPERERSIHFWQEYLQDISINPIPNFRSVNVTPRLDVLSRDFDVPRLDVESAARTLQITPQVYFQSAFAFILSSYIGSSDILFGTVFSGRALPMDGIEQVIGPCLTTLPVRVNIGQLKTAQDLMQLIHKSNRRILENSTLSLQDVKKSCGITAETSLFDAVIVWQETSIQKSTSTDLLRQVDARDFLEFYLTLEVEPLDNHIHVKATFQRCVFPSEQILLLLMQLEQLVKVFIKDQHVLLQHATQALDLDCLSIENPEYEHFKYDTHLFTSIESLAEEDPERVALECLNVTEQGSFDVESLTYKDLNARANKLAHFLLQNNASANKPVAIIMEKSVSLYVSILAVEKSGAPYLALTPQTPVDRIKVILNEADARICIVDSFLANQLGEISGIHFVPLNEIQLTGFPCSNPRLERCIRGHDLAYAVFTSGSTGKPKGVAVSQANVISNLKVLAGVYPAKDGDKLLQVCSQTFDVSVFEIFFTWFMGMTLCSTPNDVLFTDIEKVIRHLGITHLSMTPAVAALVDPKNVPTVKFLVSAGEALTPKVFNQWAENGLFNGYGPSETTNVVTVKHHSSKFGAIDNIGKPLKNTSAFIISESETFEPVVRGGVGELCFGGDQVGRGYLNMPSLTAKKFIDHSKFGRLYRTGDYGRLLPDGSLSYLGRIDDQVKVRGQRIELGEINSVLLESSLIKDCSTVLVHENDKAVRLIAFWVPMQNMSISSEGTLKSTIDHLYVLLRTKLPSYMIPSFLLPVESIPMTPNGKIDKSGLLEHYHALNKTDLAQAGESVTDISSIEEWSDTEQQICDAVTLVTNASKSDLRPWTSFFSLGIDSISAITLSRLLRGQGFDQINVSTVLRHASVRSLSNAISSQSLNNAADIREGALDSMFTAEFKKHVEIFYHSRGQRVDKLLPCTPLQEAMLSSSYSSKDGAYINHVLFRVNGDLMRLKSAWTTLSQRHQIFRTCFVTTENPRYAFAQVVLANYDLPWTSQTIPEADLRREVDNKKASAYLNLLDSQTPPYALTAFASNNKTWLLLSMHHALYDGEAMSLALAEVERAYGQEALPVVVAFDRFLGYMLNFDQKLVDTFWDEYLKDIRPFLLLNRSESIKHQRQCQTEKVQAICSRSSLTWFEEHCRQISISLSNLVQAAWAKLLSSYSSRSDICFGNVFSGRTIPLNGIEQTIGPCFNTLPIKTTIEKMENNFDLLKNLQSTYTNILPYQLTSLRRLQARRNAMKTGLFDTLLLLQKNPRSINQEIWSLDEDVGGMGLPLVFEIIPNNRDNSIQLVAHYQTPLISDEDAGTILQNFDLVLHEILRYPAARAADCEFLEKKPSFVLLPSNTVINQSMETGETVNVDTNDTTEWTEQSLAIRRVLSTLSGVKEGRIRSQTSIYQLGIDSISAIQIAALLKKEGFNVSATDVLEYPTVKDLSAFLQLRPVKKEEKSLDFKFFDTRHRLSICSKININSSDIEKIRPCTPLQAGMIAQFIHSNGVKYLNHSVMKMKPETNLEQLKKAWNMVILKYEMLRTGFAESEDPRYPFVMLTYSADASSLPWVIRSYSSNSLNLLKKKRRSIALEVLSEISKPVWRLTVAVDSMQTYVQFSAHHAIYDANSLVLILADVEKAYYTQKLDPQNEIDIALSFILRQNEDEAAAQKFWSDFGTNISFNKFPVMTPLRVSDKSFLTLSKTCTKSRTDLERDCKTLGISIHAAGQAAWARLLSAYTAESSITFGLVLSGRTYSEDAGSVAFPSITTVPITCQVDGSNYDLVKSLMETGASVMKYQFTPLTKIQKWTGRHDLKLFDTLFVYQKLSSEHRPEILWTIVDEEATVDYPISIELEPSQDGTLLFRLTFEQDILPKDQASLLLDQLNALLIDCVSSPDVQCNDMRHLDRALLSITPSKFRELQSPVRLLHQFVELQALERPNHIAFEFATGLHKGRVIKDQWTYRELDALGNRVAQALADQGIRQGNLISICFPKCPEASFGILGILKAGCGYVAVDPAAPAARKRFILGDSNSAAILTVSELKKDLQTITSIPVLAIDKYALKKFPCTSAKLERPISDDDVCYCLYTSGTTGTPKGCEITHLNAVQAMLSFQRLFNGHWDDNSRWLQFASFHFDVSVLEQYWSWSVGICVTSAPRDLIFEDLPGTIRELQITHIDLTPSLARLLHPDDVPSLCRGVFITGGEQLKQEILNAWGEKGVIYNGYGPTEATIGVTMYPRVPKNGRPSNIGPQFDNVGSFVFKRDTNIPVIRGGVGELCVSGNLVGRGYLNLPDLTANRFPYLKEYSEKIYRTGDLVRILCDGSFDFLGRADDQVKLRGQRLEIGEINEVIRQSSSDIHEVSTLVVKHPKQAKEQLVSFFSSKKRSVTSASTKTQLENSRDDLIRTVRTACEAALPPYMVPTYFLPITSIPLNVNNKADGKQLKAFFNNLSLDDLLKLTSGSGHVSPAIATAEEMQIIGILQLFSGISNDQISPSSSIFELGLDSISVIGFSRKLREAGLVGAQSSVVMKNPIISRLANALTLASSLQDSERKYIQVALQQVRAFSLEHAYSISKQLGVSLNDLQKISPCTPLQEGIISKAISSDRPLYFSAFDYELLDGIEVVRLQEAWKKATEDVEILRTVFQPTSEGYAQVLLRDSTMAWKEIWIEHDEEFRSTSERFYRQWWIENRDLIRPPWEVVVIRSPHRCIMCLHIFHALYDGNSLPLLLQRVLSAYFDDPIEPSYSFYDLLPQGPLRQIDEAKEFWMKHLKHSKHQKFPALSKKPKEHSSTITLTVESFKLQNLERVRRSLRVTDQALLQTCWLIALQETIHHVPTLGTIVSGRSIDLEGIDQVIGPLFNTIPFQPRIEQGDTWKTLTQRNHEFNVAVIPYQHTPLRDVMRWTKTNSEHPLFDTLFVYQKDLSNETRYHDRQPIWTPLESISEADYPLAFEAEHQIDGSIKLTLVSQGHISDDESNMALLKRVAETIQRLVANPDETLPILPESSMMTITEPQDQSVSINGLGNFQTNGLARSFKWTQEAHQIRNEIAMLADVDPELVGENLSILELGLDSIDAIKLASRLRKRNIILSVSSIMHGLTVAGMCRQVQDTTDGDSVSKQDEQFQFSVRQLEMALRKSSYNSSDIDKILPATPLQEAMIAEMQASKYSRYFNHDVLKLEPGVDIAHLKQAFEEVTSQSPVLRTSFVEIEDATVNFTFAQLIHRSHASVWEEVEISQEPNVQMLMEKIRKQFLQNRHLVPVRLTCVKSPDGTLLILSIAHALYDGWSLCLLHDDIANAYQGRFKQRQPNEKVLAQILGSSCEESEEFWKGALSGARSSRFPKLTASKSEMVVQVYRKEKQSSMSLNEIETFCKSHGCTLQAIGQSIWALVLSSYLRQLDVVFGVVLSGRYTEEAEEVMFPIMNTVAVRSIIHGSKRQMLRYMQNNINNIIDHQHFPLRKAKAFADTDNGVLFDTLFIYQKKPTVQATTETKVLYKSVGGSSDVEYPVCVEMEIVDGSLVWRTACKSSVLTETDTITLLNRLDFVLSEFLLHSSVDLPVLDFGPLGISISGLPPFPSFDETDFFWQANTTPTQSSTENWSPLEQTIRSVLSEVSGVSESDISKDMTLFHVGLDSISAIKVASLLRRRNVRLTVSEMLRAATIDKMAEAVLGHENVNDKTRINVEQVLNETLEPVNVPAILSALPVDASSVEAVLPATPTQAYFLSLWEASKGHLFYPCFNYRISVSTALEDTVRKRLDGAWRSLVSQMSILRTTFVHSGNAALPFLQLVLRSIDNPISWVPSVVEHASPEQIAATMPPVTLFASFVEGHKGQIDLVLRIHHALYDAVSLPILVSKLTTLVEDPETVLRQPEPSFSSFIAHSIASSDRPLYPVPPTCVSSFSGTPTTSVADVSLQQTRTELYIPHLLSDVLPALTRLARTHGVSLPSLFLASLSAQLPAHIDAETIGLYAATRSHPLLPDTLANAPYPTLSLVPLSSPSLRGTDLLARAKRIHTAMEEATSVGKRWQMGIEGMGICVWVNWLSVPAGSSIEPESECDECDRGAVHLTSRDDSTKKRAVSDVIVHEGDEAKTFVGVCVGGTGECRRMCSRGTVDVEVAVRESMLDVGVFADGGVLALDGAEVLVQGLVRELEEACRP